MLVISYCIGLFVPARPVANTIKSLRLQRDNFETLKIIGKGAFGEVCHHFSMHVFFILLWLFL